MMLEKNFEWGVFMKRRAWLLFTLFVVIAVSAMFQNTGYKELVYAGASHLGTYVADGEESPVCGIERSEFQALVQSVQFARHSFIHMKDGEEIARRMWWGSILGLNESLQEPFSRSKLEGIVKKLRRQGVESVRPEIQKLLRSWRAFPIGSGEDFFRFLSLVCHEPLAHMDRVIERAYGALNDPYTFFKPPLRGVRRDDKMPQHETSSVQSLWLGTDMFLLSVRSLEGEEGKKVRTELEKVVGVCASANVILDLRGNAGGSVGNAIEVAGVFLGRRPIVRLVERGGREITKIPSGRAVPLGWVVVLVDRETASAAEIIASALREGKGAVLVGQRTYGKGVSQLNLSLGNGGESFISNAFLLPANPESSAWHGVGIEPDIAPGTFSMSGASSKVRSEITKNPGKALDDAVVTAFRLVREVYDTDPSCQ
jgi:hypothetical protein